MELFRKNLIRIDLLPESVQAKKRFRRRIRILAAIQAAMFICIGLVAVFLNALEHRAWDESFRLTAQINYMRQNQAVAAAVYTHDAAWRISAEEAFLEINASDEFNPTWLTAILSACDGSMTTLDYSRGFILLTGVADNMTKIESHRQSLLNTDVFLYVRIGRTALQECGRFFYELRIDIP